MITNKLCSDGAARRQVMLNVEHQSPKGLSNRAESNVPLRKRERMMQGFRSAGALERFTSVFCRQKFIRSAPFQSFRSFHPTSPSQGSGRMEIVANAAA